MRRLLSVALATGFLLLPTGPAQADPPVRTAPRVLEITGTVASYEKGKSVTLKEDKRTFYFNGQTQMVGTPAPGATVYVQYSAAPDGKGRQWAEKVQSPAPGKK